MTKQEWINRKQIKPWYTHNFFKKFFSKHKNILNFILYVSIGAFFFLYSRVLEPLLTNFFQSKNINEIPIWIDIVFFLLLVGLLIISWFFNEQEKLQECIVLDEDYIDESEIFFIGINEYLKVINVDDQIKDFLQLILQKILTETRTILNDFNKNLLQVTLLTFKEENNELKISIFQRAEARRKKDVTVIADKMMAYYVALQGESWIEHNFQHPKNPFGHESPSEDFKYHAKYESILFIPLIIEKEGKNYCLGVITIDSKKAYHFWDEKNKILEQIEKKTALSTHLMIKALKDIDFHKISCNTA